jgi:hypothetical protein
MTEDVKKKPVSPSHREKPWVAVALRKPVYALLKDMAKYENRTIGGQMSWLIEQAYDQIMPEKK